MGSAADEKRPSIESPAAAARPATRGLSPSRLAQRRDVMRRHVGSGRLPGLVLLISRRGEEHADAIGTLAFDRTAPMRRDTIFRLASVTKPITAAATMILVEECMLRLVEPVDEWLPELANRRVLRRWEMRRPQGFMAQVEGEPGELVATKNWTEMTARSREVPRLVSARGMVPCDTDVASRSALHLLTSSMGCRRSPPGVSVLRRAGSWRVWREHSGRRPSTLERFVE
jgi:hypothetical protein